MQLLFAMDDAAANWYSYHFHDTLFLNDTAWVYWHIRLQELLSEDQLQGRTCAFCGTAMAVLPVLSDQDSSLVKMSPTDSLRMSQVAPGPVEHIAGYTIRCCKEPCHIQLE
jgi:hypothetical protein